MKRFVVVIVLVLGLTACGGESYIHADLPAFIGPANFFIQIECGHAGKGGEFSRLITVGPDGTVTVRENSEKGRPIVYDTAVTYTLITTRMNEIFRLIQDKGFFSVPPYLMGPDHTRYCRVRMVSDRKDHTVYQAGKNHQAFNDICRGLNQYLLSGCEIIYPELDALDPGQKRAAFPALLSKGVNSGLAIRLYERELDDPSIERRADTAYALAELYRRAGNTANAWHYARMCRDLGREDDYNELAKKLEPPPSSSEQIKTQTQEKPAQEVNQK